MADTHETITDIIREARDKYTVHNCNECNYRKSCDWNDWNFGSVECEAKRQSISLLLGIDDDYFNKLLTRLEAAHKREVREAEDLFRKSLKKQEDTLRDQYEALVGFGNRAKLREALEAFVRAYDEPIELDNIEATSKAYEQARAALDAPPRNCDVARDWMRDLYAHFQPPASIKREMPPEWVDSVMAFCRWLVAPATEKEGGAK